jgi:vacuolar-type H+-ATPase subunit H
MSDEETTTTETAETTKKQTATTTEEAGVVEIPKNIDFKLNTNFKKVLYEDLVITNINGAMSLKEGVASMDNLKMNMLDGTLNMNGDYSTADITKPSASMVFAISDFDINKTYNSFKVIQESAPIAKNCSGKFSMMLTYKSLLNDSMMPVMETVNGAGLFSSNKITIDNSDVFNKLAGLLKNDKYKTVELNDLDVKFKIVDGNIEVEPFKTKSGNIDFEIGGKQGIDQSLDYKMNIKVPSSELGSSANEIAGKLSALAGANGVNISMPEVIDINGLITGTVQKPKISLDLKQQGQDVVNDIKEQVQEVVKQEIDKAKKQAIEEAKKQAAKLLAEAQKQAESIKKTAQQTAKSRRSNGKKAADDNRKEAKKQGDKLIKDAGMNPIKKAAAKEAAKQLTKEADKKANKVENEANKKADKLVNDANKKADGIVKTAKQKGDELIKKAENA